MKRAAGLIVVAVCAVCAVACGRTETFPLPALLDATADDASGAADAAIIDAGDLDAGDLDAPPEADAADAIHHYEYVIPYTSTGEVDVYDLDQGFALARSFTIGPLAGLTSDNIRGIVASAATGMLYVSWNPNDVLGYDLVGSRVVWTQTYTSGIDSMAITPDGKTLFLPSGGGQLKGLWLVLDASSGAVTGSIDSGGVGPHNTIVTLDGARVFLGPLHSNSLVVADARTHAVLGTVGPTTDGVRPFTINGKGTLAFITTSSFLGYFVGDVASGKILYTVSPPGYAYGLPSFAGTTGIAHGVSLSPDERELWMIDYPHSTVHVFDVTGLPAAPPRDIADIPLKTMQTGEGWVQHTRDGRYVVVGNSGDVIDARTHAVVGNLPALLHSRIFTEIDVQGGRPVFSALSRNQGGYQP